MIKNARRILVSIVAMLLLLINNTMAMAQENGPAAIDMADRMRSEGKIYVVVVVVAIVFTGLIIFAIRSDRKISSLEREIKSLKSGKDS